MSDGIENLCKEGRECPNCGEEIPDDEKNCLNCGLRVGRGGSYKGYVKLGGKWVNQSF